MNRQSRTPKEIHANWQETGIFAAKDQFKKPKFYCLDMFPYPSAQGLHVGHPEGYTATDIISRYKRMNGFNVLHPMGWDAFGLPAENYAIKTGVDPDSSTHANIENFRRQIQSLGFSYDWAREIDTASPEYYRWTQWMFLQMFQHGLAYKKKACVNWCSTCQTVLANEQVVDGMCERSKDPVVQKELEQWFFKITDYAERLLNDLEQLDWPEPIKLMQRNWIGRSEGVNVRCKIKGFDYEFDIFDSVPQTFMAQTFSVIAANHPLLPEIVKGTEQEQEVLQCADRIQKAKIAKKYGEDEVIDGVFTGRYIQDPYGTGDLPLWVASFVVMDYGSGIVNCSAHDERDFAFAKKFHIPLRPVMFPTDSVEAIKVRNLEYCYHHDSEGVLESPVEFAGRTWGEVREDIIKHFKKTGMGVAAVQYKIRDWLISRQRYWGAPIPIVYDPEGKPHPVDEQYLPLLLPTDVDFRPKGTSPLGSSKTYAALAEKLYGKGWYFEIDTMDTFVCSSWYYLRYCDPANTKEFASIALLKQWLPVDLYVGGAEHAVLHLLYARFFHKALQDFGVVPKEVGPEPFRALRNQGMILGEDHQKMSKSRGNVINPDDIVQQYGADALRLYEMFLGPFEDVKPWNTDSIKGVARFLDRVIKLPDRINEGANTQTLVEKTIKKVTADIVQFKFNTAIAQMMVCVSGLEDEGVRKNDLMRFLSILSPFAPYTTQQVWESLEQSDLIATQNWPQFDAALTVSDEVTLAIQVNGKTRGTVTVSRDAAEEEVKMQAFALAGVQKYTVEKEVVKVVYVPGRILNIVMR